MTTFSESPGVTRRLVELNVRASGATQAALDLPTDRTLWETFEAEVPRRICDLPDGATVLDLGGGRRCVYHHALRPALKLISVDISEEELALNEHADEKVTADVSQGIPVPDATVDLLVSRAVLEHVSDVAAAARHMARVVKPGGMTMHLVPARYSLFGMAARWLPFKPLLWLVHRVMPHTIDEVEFDVFYDRGWPSAMEAAFRDAGFREVSVEVTWAQPGYFEWFYPLFLAHAVYEAIVRRLGIRRLAAYMVVRAVR